MIAELERIKEQIAKLDPVTKAALQAETDKAFKGLKWFPTVGPQAQAYDSKADILGYGGQAGGGKSDLLLGLAFTRHKRSLLMRRHYTDFSAITDRAIEINGTRKGYNGSVPMSLDTVDNRLIEFGACANPGDEQQWMGRPHDFLGVDEATQFLESQVRFLMGWVRDTDPKQRTRVVLATNPPLTAEGQWFFEMFRPWVDEGYPNRAKYGQLLWYAMDEHGRDIKVDGPDPVTISGQLYRPMSRTFIPAALGDNPFLSHGDYQARLDTLPEPLRSAIRDGNFQAGRRDDERQAIPSQWVVDAQKRWKPEPPKESPMCAIGVDVARGGAAETVLAPRYDGWFAALVVVRGAETPQGTDVAALVVKHRRNQAMVIIDMGGGYGGAPLEHLKANGISVRGFKGAEKSNARTKDRQLGFYNKRAEAWWKFREALDPSQEGGSPIMLPNDSSLFADLVSPTFEVTSRGIKLEEKDEIVKRLGRSPDRGDAVVMAWAEGPTTQTHGEIWRRAIQTAFRPNVSLGHDAQRRRW